MASAMSQWHFMLAGFYESTSWRAASRWADAQRSGAQKIDIKASPEGQI